MKNEDLDRACKMYKDANRFTSEKNIRSWTSKELRKFPEFHFVYEENGKILGSISGLKRGNSGILQDIAVDKNYRRQGIGKKLMKFLMSKFKRGGVRKVQLWVRHTSAESLPFYYKNGFSVVTIKLAHRESFVPEGDELIFLEKRI